MLVHLTELMEDTTLFSFPNARNFHGIVLGLMEQGDLSWTDTAAIDKLRQQYSRVNSPVNPTTSTPHSLPSTDDRPCPDYQTGTCTISGDHDLKGVRVAHICAWCARMKRLSFPHREKECISKERRTSKND
jgi:hypothetical protein